MTSPNEKSEGAGGPAVPGGSPPPPRMPQLRVGDKGPVVCIRLQLPGDKPGPSLSGASRACIPSVRPTKDPWLLVRR